MIPEKLTKGYIVKVEHPALSLSGKKLFVNKGYLVRVLLFLDIAEQLGIKVYITSSFRFDSKKIKGAVVKPAKMSNHFIGFAFDCNFIESDGTWWNSHKLRHPEGKVKELIDYSKKINIRWGISFDDPVHFDVPINIEQPEVYQFYYNKIHFIDTDDDNDNNSLIINLN